MDLRCVHVCVCVCVSVCETEGDMDDICFPGYYQVPIDVTAGWAAFPVYTRSPWSNVSKVFLLKETTTTPSTKMYWAQIKPTTFWLASHCPDRLLGRMSNCCPCALMGVAQVGLHTISSAYNEIQANQYSIAPFQQFFTMWRNNLFFSDRQQMTVMLYYSQ